MLPAFKRVTIDFMNVDNVNSFTSFPLLPTGGIAPVSNGLKWEFSSLGTFTFDGINDQQFFNRINMQVSNQGVNAGQLTFGWALVARPAGTGSDTLNQSPSNNGWTKYMYLDIANSPPVAWGTSMGSLNSGSMPHNPVFNIGIGTTLVDITAGGIANYPFFPASVFTAGQWEIGYYTKTEVLTTQSVPHSYWSYNGRFVPDSIANPLTNPYMNGVTYTNTGATTGINASEFAPIINGAIGSASTTTNLYQTGDDTAYEEVNDIIMGDTGSNFSEGCIQIYTGSVWKASDFAGFWGIDTLAGGNSFSQQLAEDIFKAQSKSIDKFTLSTTIDASESIYWNDGTANRPQWACPFTKFMTQPNALQGMVQKAFIMHTGTYDFLTDTWKWVLYQQAAFTVGATVTTTNTLGVNSGLSGYGGSPSPVGGGPSALVGPPNPISGTGNSIRLLNQQQIQPVAIIRAGQYLAQGTGIQSITVTSLSVKQLPAAIFKIGDKLVLQTKSNDDSSRISESNPQYNTNRIEFVVSANQLINATTISVTSKTIYQDISVGDTITFNAANLYSQYQNKTEGSVAGFEVDADGLTKGGVEITGWLNSDTMTGATVNNLPTALSVKNYVDNSHPAEDQTLQEVTDNGNTTTNSIMIGSSSAPTYKLDVVGGGLKTTTATSNRISYYNGDGINSYGSTGFTLGNYSNNLTIKNEADDKDIIFKASIGTAASSEKMRITSSGNVGIGTTSPSAKLEISDSVPIMRITGTRDASWTINEIMASLEFFSADTSGSAANSVRASINLVNEASVYGSTTGISFSTKGDVSGLPNEKMRLNSSGNLGIGTTNPTEKLTVESVSGFIATFKSLTATDFRPVRWVNSDGANVGFLGNNGTTNTFNLLAQDRPLIFGTGSGAAERMRITSSGNVGIGTTAPDTTRPLTIEGNSYGQIRVNNTSATKFGGLLSYNEIGKYGIFGVGGSNHNAVELRNNTFIEAINGSDISFRTGNSFSAVITSAGNVGIGTTSPEEKLSVSGSIQLTNQQNITWSDIGDGNTGRVAIRGSEDNDWIMFKTDNSERMRLTNTGLGIGTTSPSRKLDVEGRIRFSSNSNQTVNGYAEIYTSYAYGKGQTYIAPEGVTNPANFHPNGGVTIGAASTSPPANGLIVAGNVGIGTTAPTTKLEVDGTGKFTGQVTIPATPIATTDAASKSYVDAQSSTAMSVFSMLTCSTTTITSASDGVANAVVMKFDTEAITYGPSGSIVSYGSGGIEGIENSQFCWMNIASLLSRYFEFQWNVTSDTNTVTNRVLSGIRIEEGILEETTLSWSEISPTTSYIYDRGSGNIKKGSTAGSILISMPAGELKRYYRMVFWKEKASNNSVKSESVLNGTQITLKQLK